MDLLFRLSPLLSHNYCDHKSDPDRLEPSLFRIANAN